MPNQENHYACSVSVATQFMPEHSDVTQNNYGFVYHVTITNMGTMPAQLISRHWIITEANGEQREVKGLGVVGEQPLIHPNESFMYSSSTMMQMPMGEMHGTYQMVAEDGTTFDAIIPPFTLQMPRVLH